MGRRAMPIVLAAFPSLLKSELLPIRTYTTMWASPRCWCSRSVRVRSRARHRHLQRDAPGNEPSSKLRLFSSFEEQKILVRQNVEPFREYKSGRPELRNHLLL